MAHPDRVEHLSQVAAIVPIAVPIAIICVYAGNGISLWMTVGAILMIVLLGIGYMVRKLVLPLLFFVILAPSIANLHWAVPTLVAVSLGICWWRLRPRDRGGYTILQVLPIACTIVVTLGVAASVGVVLVVSTVNACVEELLWRVNLAELFRSAKLFVVH